MTKALDVALAVKAMIVAAYGNQAPRPDVLGLDSYDAAPDRIGANGRFIVEFGNPGRPDVDLCPPTYNYAHQIPVTVEAPASSVLTPAQVVDTMLAVLGAAIEVNRSLGGLIDYLDASAPESVDDFVDGAPVIRSATVTLVAIYSTPHPI